MSRPIVIAWLRRLGIAQVAALAVALWAVTAASASAQEGAAPPGLGDPWLVLAQQVPAHVALAAGAWMIAGGLGKLGAGLEVLGKAGQAVAERWGPHLGTIARAIEDLAPDARRALRDGVAVRVSHDAAGGPIHVVQDAPPRG